MAGEWFTFSTLLTMCWRLGLRVRRLLLQIVFEGMHRNLTPTPSHGGNGNRTKFGS